MRRTRATIERIERVTGYAWNTLYAIVRARGHRLSALTDAQIIEVARWHRAAQRTVRASCDYCGADGQHRYDVEADAIVCARGAGCSRRRPEDERTAKLPSGNWSRQYRHTDGYWYTLQEVADLAGITTDAAYQRMRAGWTVADAIEDISERPAIVQRVRRALDAQGSA